MMFFFTSSFSLFVYSSFQLLIIRSILLFSHIFFKNNKSDQQLCMTLFCTPSQKSQADEQAKKINRKVLIKQNVWTFSTQLCEYKCSALCCTDIFLYLPVQASILLCFVFLYHMTMLCFLFRIGHLQSCHSKLRINLYSLFCLAKFLFLILQKQKWTLKKERKKWKGGIFECVFCDVEEMWCERCNMCLLWV